MKEQPTAVGSGSCPRVSNDHPPMCQQPEGSSCFKCEHHLDGITDLLPWDEDIITKDQKTLLTLYKRRDKLYASMDAIYDEIKALADEINVVLKRVKKEQGR